MARNRVPSAYRQPGYAGVVFVYLLVIGGLAGLAYWVVDHERRIMAALRFEADVAAMTLRVDMPTPPAIRASLVEPVPTDPSPPAGTGRTDAPDSASPPPVARPSMPVTGDSEAAPADDTPAGAPAGSTAGGDDPGASAPASTDGASPFPTAGDGDAPPGNGTPQGGIAGDGPQTETTSLAEIIREGLNRGTPQAGEADSPGEDAPAVTGVGTPVRRPEPPRLLAETGGLASPVTTGEVVADPTGGPGVLLPEPGDTAGTDAAPDTRSGAGIPAATIPASDAPSAEPGPDAPLTDIPGSTGPADETHATGTGPDTAVPAVTPAAADPAEDEDDTAVTVPTASAAGPAGSEDAAAPSEDDQAPVSLGQLDRLAGLEDAGGAASLMRPRELNAEPFVGHADMPVIVLIVHNLGSFHAEAQSAIDLLPANVTLAFSPYGEDLDGLIRRARGSGHEVLMMLPMEASAAVGDDPGPRTLRTDLSDEQNRRQLEAINDITARHVGLIGLEGDRFLGDASAARLLFTDLADAGYLFVGPGAMASDRLMGQAAQAGLPTAWVDLDVTADPGPQAVATALRALEEDALENGLAVGVAEPLPAFLEQVTGWADGLVERGVALAPISSAVQIDADE